MEFMGKKLEDIIVTLPLADGSMLECGVFASFSVKNNNYMALLPLTEDKQLDRSQSFMLYKVEMDEEDNPTVVYIEDDQEYAEAANCFAGMYLD